MRTKALLLAAALSAAGIATSMAQVYSVNAVGYVNVNVPAGKLAIVANPLNGTNNHVNTIMWLPEGSSGATIFRFNTTIQNFEDPYIFLDGFGWTATVDPIPPLDPGEAFFFQNVGATDIPITFVGEVPQGSLSNPVPGNYGLALRASQVPQAAPLGDTSINKTNSLEFPAGNGDTVFVFDVNTQNYKEPYIYLESYGWTSANADDNGPSGPVIPVASGFWTQKATAAAPWTRNFSVN